MMHQLLFSNTQKQFFLNTRLWWIHSFLDSHKVFLLIGKSAPNLFQPFHVVGLFLTYPQEKSGFLMFLRGYRKRLVAWTGTVSFPQRFSTTQFQKRKGNPGINQRYKDPKVPHIRSILRSAFSFLRSNKGNWGKQKVSIATNSTQYEEWKYS